MQNLLNPESLVELHEKLNEFAEYHQNKGGQQAHKIVKNIWDEWGLSPKDGSENAMKYNEGYDNAFKFILGKLHERFVQ